MFKKIFQKYKNVKIFLQVNKLVSYRYIYKLYMKTLKEEIINDK